MKQPIEYQKVKGTILREIEYDPKQIGETPAETRLRHRLEKNARDDERVTTEADWRGMIERVRRLARERQRRHRAKVRAGK